jgi:hypothetical protein
MQMQTLEGGHCLAAVLLETCKFLPCDIQADSNSDISPDL